MSYYYSGFAPYVPVAQRRRQALAEVAKLKKKGKPVKPVIIEGRAIATTFWGKAWCDNLEAYSDYANRLPRGRTYVRNGSVVDLHIEKGRLEALVSGSSMYRASIEIVPVAAERWSAIAGECGGKIDSVVELLSGRLSTGVMAVLCRQGSGLFPSNKEIKLSCSCPDGAWLCKHLAAVLYGVGARLDREPELLFELRGVDKLELVSAAGAGKAFGAGSGAAELGGQDLEGIFGIELVPGAAAPKPARKTRAVPPVPAKKPSRRGAAQGRPEPKARATKGKAKASTRSAKAPRKPKARAGGTP